MISVTAGWIGLALVAAWIGATGAAARRELAALETGTGPVDDYALVSRLRRLRDDAKGFALRLRWSRAVAAAGVPLALACVVRGPWVVRLIAAVLGALLVAVAEASAGGTAWRGLCRAREGLGYALWARVTQPALPLSRALVLRRAARAALPEAAGLVLAETRAAMSPAGGRLGIEERRFLRRLLASTSIRVADVMTPWKSARTLPANADLRTALAQAHAAGRSRFPVLQGQTPVGLVTVRDLLMAHDAPSTTVDTIRRPLYFVRQEQTVRELLEELRNAHVHLAVVVDRLGRPVGIVTMEDVLEEIVGEIHDERERRRGDGR